MRRSVRIILGVAGAASVSAGAMAQTAGGPGPGGGWLTPTIDNPNRNAVTNIAAVRRFFQLAATRRVDLAIIGDSNTRGSGVGHEEGMGRAFIARFGAYATGVQPGVGVVWWGSPVGGVSAYQTPPFQVDDAPTGVATRSFASDGFLSTYALLPADQSLPWNYNAGLGLLPTCPLDLTGALRYHGTHYVFPRATGGYVNFTCRPSWPDNSYPNYATMPTMTTVGVAGVGGTAGIRDFSFDVPPGPRSASGLDFCPTNVADQLDAHGPFCLTYQRVESPARATGVAYSALWGKGGQSAHDALADFQTALGGLVEWVRQGTRLQNGPGVLMVQILHGGNDINAHAPSLGPIGGLDSSTKAGQQDNTRGLMEVIRTAWRLNGNDPANLFFLLGPYHPRPDDPSPLPDYEAGWRDIAENYDPQVIVCAGTMLSRYKELATRRLTVTPLDGYHLSPEGYMVWGRVTLSALARAACPADYDENGTLAVSDIFAFLEAWFGGQKAADFNNSGSLEVQDVFDYLNAWFGGC